MNDMEDKAPQISTIDGGRLIGFQIENFKEPAKKAIVAQLSRLNPVSARNISEIVEICNQEAVYELFREKLNGNQYQETNAQSFITWANQGWEENTHFAYLIKTHEGKIIGAVDIKSNNPDFGEIGYWADERYPGYMTNAVAGLVDQAKQAGYRLLVAYTKLDNEKSKRVLARAGFRFVGKEERKPGALRDKFVINLEA